MDDTTPAQGPKLLYTAEEAAVLLSVPASWLKRKAGKGEVPSTQVGRYRRFSQADLDRGDG